MTRRDLVRVFLITFAITIPVCAAAGAVLGLYGQRVGITPPVRMAILLIVAVISGRVSSQYAQRRVLSGGQRRGATP